DPNAKFLNVLASKNASESHGEPTHGREIRRCTFQSVDLCCLTWRQQPPRLDAWRSRDDWRDRPPGRGIDGAGDRRDRRRRRCRRLGRWRQSYDFGASGAPPLRQEPLQMGEASGIAAELDLVEQLSAANAAFRPM